MNSLNNLVEKIMDKEVSNYKKQLTVSIRQDLEKEFKTKAFKKQVKKMVKEAIDEVFEEGLGSLLQCDDLEKILAKAVKSVMNV